ncbi:MAG: peptidylprolyl isomerase, partial [Candidatus Paceibacterota bacterium]
MASIKSIVLVVVISLGLVFALVFLFADTQSESELIVGTKESETFDGPRTSEEHEIRSPSIINSMNQIAHIKTNQGVIIMELFGEQMPITVGNFVNLAQSGFYDNTKFHRVIEGFMIQGGDPNTKGNNEAMYGQGGPDQNIQDEFVDGELLTNTRGTIAMANTGQPNSGGSQFFINLGDNTSLDFDKEPLSSKHPVFGRVTDGMDIVDAIARTETKAGDIPVAPIVIESIEI